MANLYTIGFTQKSAERFFELLRSNGVKTVIDTRLNNTGQLAGFSKRDDLAYFLNKLGGIKYVHWTESAPTESLLTAYKKKQITWDEYASRYRSLISDRSVQSSAIAQLLESSCLLCSEAKPHKCHRRLLAEYLSERSPGSFTLKHLV